MKLQNQLLNLNKKEQVMEGGVEKEQQNLKNLKKLLKHHMKL